jgi:hypothetical protein
MNQDIGQQETGDGKPAVTAGGRSFAALTSLALLGFLVLAVVSFPGCGKPPKISDDTIDGPKEKEAGYGRGGVSSRAGRAE